MTKEEGLKLIAELMDLDDDDELNLDTELDSLDSYDSFFKLYLVSHMKKMNVRLTVDEILEFKTVGDICDYLVKNSV